ncbi:catalase [Candidatus Bathyarchaeota archaeon]|nr:catalase [Candidatus Bathyarchaeota archaeon]
MSGIESSSNKLLQGRVFSYADTQRYQLGPNYLQLPVNQPLVSVNNDQRYGAMQYAPYVKGTVNYEPNTLPDGMPREAPALPTGNYHIGGKVAHHKISLTNDFQQAGEHYHSLGKIDKDHLVDNLADSLSERFKNHY